MDSNRVFKREDRKPAVHDRDFVSRARDNRRLRNIVAKEQRARTRRINEERSFAFWVRKMQRKAKAIMEQQFKGNYLFPGNIIRL